MGVVVAIMGAAFVVTALMLRPDVAALVKSTVRPTIPPGGGLLVVGLIGTTIVPYNLFLGSALARGQTLGRLRLGLGIAIPLGGLISVAVMIVGTAVDGPFDFVALSDRLADELGPRGRQLFAVGLMCAGLSSAITAPLTAALTARGLAGGTSRRWDERGARYRSVWLSVLSAGVFFGLTGVKPIPAILLAQALNGLLLPIAAAYLILVVNDRRIMGADGLNHARGNVALGVTFVVTVVLGTSNLLRAGSSIAGTDPVGGRLLGAVVAALTLCVSGPLYVAVRRRRRV
jgi:Mn2+/Fe2+ NRAMP family transporter